MRRVEVVGESMVPTLLPGDRLLVSGLAASRCGDLVAVEDPERAGLVLVKRLAARQGDRLWVAGDNIAASRDSRQFGPLDRAALWGRVVYRYHPAERAGWVRRVDRSHRRGVRRGPDSTGPAAPSAP